MRRSVECDTELEANRRRITEATRPGYEMSPVVVVVSRGRFLKAVWPIILVQLMAVLHGDRLIVQFTYTVDDKDDDDYNDKDFVLLSQHLRRNPLLDRTQPLRPRCQAVGQTTYLFPR